MKLSTKALSNALASLSKLPATKMSLPILYCVKLEVKGNALNLTASNLDEHAIESVEVEGKIPTTCVSLKHLSYSLTASEETTIEVDGAFLLIKPSGAQLAMNNAEEFPEFPKGKKMEAIGVNCQDLADCIEAIQRFKALEADRYALQPVHAIGEPKRLYAEASDGRRLAWIEKAVISVDFDILVMGTFCANFCAALRREGATFSRDENNLTIKHKDGAYTCKSPEIQYPNTENVKPKDTMKSIGQISVEEFSEVVSLGLHLSSGRFSQSTKLEFSGDGLRISFNDPKHSAKMDKTIEGEFEDFDCALDLKYVLDALTAFRDLQQATIDVLVVDNLSPVKFSAGGLEVLTMPMRLN